MQILMMPLVLKIKALFGAGNTCFDIAGVFFHDAQK